jgi:hypothetical protein
MLLRALVFLASAMPRAVGGTDGKEYPRSPVCAKIVSALFTSVADRLFVDAAFDEATHEAGTRLAGEVKQAWAK